MEQQDMYLRLDLQFFAKDGPGGAKTEPPSGKKLREAREEGQTAKSAELIKAVSLYLLFLILRNYAGTIGNGIMEFMKQTFKSIPIVIKENALGASTNLIFPAVGEVFITILELCLPIFVLAMVVGVIMNMVQQTWMVTSKPLRPRLDKFNPISGFKRIFSMRQVVELLKSIAMIVVISVIVYNSVKDQYGLLYLFYEMSLQEAVVVIGEFIIDVGLKISAVFLIIGIIDMFYQKHKFNEDMKMTKQEVKDEYKNTEGDPQVKSQIRRRMHEASRRRMMAALPQADVVITNPTHFAVALKYDPDSGKAPYVLAKGADYLAFQIRDKAKEYQIEIVENKPLARLLYNNVEIGDEIPQELYQAVAEVLAFVYRIKNKI